MHLKNRLIISFILVIVVLTAFLVVVLTRMYHRNLVNHASASILSIVEQNNIIINAKLEEFENASVRMLADRTMHEVFSNLEDMPRYALIRSVTAVNQLIASYLNMRSLHSAQLYTSSVLFGNLGENPVSLGRIEQTGFLEIARQAQGNAVWISGYDYFEVYGIDHLPWDAEPPYRRMITMVRQMNFTHMDRYEYRTLSREVERPVLLVNIQEEILRNIYDSSIPGFTSIYMIINEAGYVVSSNRPEFPAASVPPAEFLDFWGMEGFYTALYQGVPHLFCFSPVSGAPWSAIVAIPYGELVEQATRDAMITALVMAVLLSLAAIGLAIGLSVSTTKPLAQMVHHVRLIGEGDFSEKMPIPTGGDFKQLAEAFNRMQSKLNDLAEENYQAGMREREAHINLLTIQINPHFLANTLSCISMLAIQNGDYKASNLIKSLSDMLHYTFKNQSEKVPLRDELEWLKNYLDIMAARYRGVFEVEIDIPVDLQDYLIPKLILQPFLENSITHGFRHLLSGGILTISIADEEENLACCIADNGCGFDVNQTLPPGAHTGIENVDHRLKLLYGPEYGVNITSEGGKGTEVRFLVKKERN